MTAEQKRKERRKKIFWDSTWLGGWVCALFFWYAKYFPFYTREPVERVSSHQLQTVRKLCWVKRFCGTHEVGATRHYGLTLSTILLEETIAFDWCTDRNTTAAGMSCDCLRYVAVNHAVNFWGSLFEQQNLCISIVRAGSAFSCYSPNEKLTVALNVSLFRYIYVKSLIYFVQMEVLFKRCRSWGKQNHFCHYCT